MNEFAERYFQYAIVDIGANSVRMNIYEIDTRTGAYTVLSSARSMLGLAAYVENGAITADGRGKLFSVIREFLARANSMPCDRFSAFATASLRGLAGGELVLAEVKAKLGVEIEIISGEAEALFDLVAVRSRFPEAPRGVVIDMGGGSTEIVPFEGERTLSVQSLPIGCVALAKKFTSCTKKTPFPTEKELSDIRAYVRGILAEYPALASIGGTAYLVGGTGRAAAKIFLSAGEGGSPSEGFTFSVSAMKKAAEIAWNDARTGGKRLQKLVPDRVTSVIPGITAYMVIAEVLGIENFVVSLAGVREGYLLDFIKREIGRRGSSENL